MIDETLAVSKRIVNSRTVQDILCTVQEEVGELATEVRIKYGQSYKEPGKDGIQGEAVDAIAALLDLIYIDNPAVTKEEIILNLNVKLAKWELSESAHALGIKQSELDV